MRRRLHALGSGIVFTRVWEDGEADRRGLAIERGGRVLVIAAAGDRALDAVAWGAGQVVAVDRSAAQMRLTALKVAAAATLRSEDLIALFSEGHHSGARRLYHSELRHTLDATDRAYWDRWIDIFEVGLHEHQPLGLGVAAVSGILRLVGGRDLASVIMNAPDAATQGRLYEARLRQRYWNPLTRWALGRGALLRWVVIHPGERDSMRSERFHEWLELQFGRIAATTLVRENPYWMPLLGGRPVAPDHETAWLQPWALGLVRAAPDRIRLVQGSVVDVIAAMPAGSLDAVGLSNVPDWLTPPELERLWAGLARVLTSGGRVIVRSAFREAPLPHGPAAALLAIDAPASADLTATERTGLYTSVTLLRRAGFAESGSV